MTAFMPAWAVRSSERHRSGIILGGLLLAAMAPWLPELSLAQQFWIVLLPVMVFGMSHGGADPIIMGDLKRLRGQGNLFWLSGYLVLMFLAVAVIWWQPELALLGFLLMSAMHFAKTDLPFLRPGAPPLVGWLSGSLPIIGPMVGYPEQVAVLFAWLLQYDPGLVLPWLRMAAIVLALGWILCVCAAVVIMQADIRLRVLAELGTLACVSLLLPPLLAFAFYFCAIHSVRHFIMLMISLRSRQAGIEVGKLARLAAPATILAITMGLFAWWGLQTVQPAGEQTWLADGVRVMFWGLAVLTVPHALLVMLWKPPASTAQP